MFINVCVHLCLCQSASVYFARACVRVYVSEKGRRTSTKTEMSRMAYCLWCDVVCVFMARTKHTVYKRNTHLYAIEHLIRLNWMVFDYYRVTGAWRSFMWTKSYGNKEYRNTVWCNTLTQLHTHTHTWKHVIKYSSFSNVTVFLEIWSNNMVAPVDKWSWQKQ